MPISYDKNGLVIQNLSEILTERESVLRSIFGDDFYISGESAVANTQSSDADRELSIQELLLYIATQLDPNQAEGIWLDYICALNNITRYVATQSTIPITVNGTPGTTKNAGELIIVDEATDEYYINENPIALDINGTTNTTFKATNYGPITALSTSSFAIKTPSIGITSVEYNTDGRAVVGRNTETDEELRARRENNLYKTATSTLNSIKSEVSDLLDVQAVQVYENDTNSTVDSIPAKSFEVVVLGGNDNEIANIIFAKKPAGIQAYGSTTIPIVDGLTTVNIGFTRPTNIPVELRITFTSSETQPDEWKSQVKDALVSKFNEEFNVGDDVYVYKLYSVLNSFPEIIDVTNFEVETVSDGTWASSVDIASRELATLSVENISITQSS